MLQWRILHGSCDREGHIPGVDSERGVQTDDSREKQRGSGFQGLTRQGRDLDGRLVTSEVTGQDGLFDWIRLTDLSCGYGATGRAEL